MADPTPALTPELVRYFAAMDQQRIDQVAGRMARFTERERRLVREAAVHGWVLGVRQSGGKQRDIPHDAEIVFRVVLGCDAQSDLYPLIGEHVEASDDDD